MKKFFRLLAVLLAVSLCVYFYDIYSGYRITSGVGEVLYAERNDKAESNDETEGNNLNSLLYSQLSRDEQNIYTSIYNGLTQFKRVIFIRGMPEYETVFKIMHAVISEHPEIFWTKGDCTYSGAGLLTPEYFYSKSTAQEIRRQIEAEAEKVISSISGDDYERSLALFDYVTLNTAYDRENEDNLNAVPADSTIEGVFLKKRAVCSGYAKAYQYLLKESGMQALLVTGTATSRQGENSHA